MSSIRVRLLKWLVGPVVLVNLGAATLAYQLAWKPAQLAFDQSLLDAAHALAASAGAGGAAAWSAGAPRLAASDGVDTMWFALHDTGGHLLAGVPDLPVSASGAGMRDARMRGELVRVATIEAPGPSGLLRIDVARTARARAQVRDAIVRALVLLEVVFSLALAGLVWFSVTNGLAPLARLRAALDRRASADLAPLDVGRLPHELAPVVGAFNGLLGRIDADAQAQREFQSNIAHQLRTPLAGIKLQLEWLAGRHRGDPETSASVGLMLQANERLIRETNQLLSLARAAPQRLGAPKMARLDLAELVGESVQAFVDQAGARAIDLGFALEPAPLRGDRFLLRDLIDNLVDNALRYTPGGGSVTVRCHVLEGSARLEVADNGPGIAPEQRRRVFERFVRLDPATTGSGLGLAIVRDIAQAHGAQVDIDSGADGKGAVFTVRFPAA
jgi:two-component system, OmpR family, sensor histidine kinase TctE